MPETVYRSLTETTNPIRIGRGSFAGTGLRRRVVALNEDPQDCSPVVALDPITRLPNRESILAALARECFRASAGRAPVSAVLLDLDGIAAIRAQHGRVAGAEALRRYARLLRRLTRATDVLGRLEEHAFLLVLSAWAPEAWRCAERLRAAVAQAVLTPEWDRCTVSAGIASTEWPSAGDALVLVEQAAAILLAAKQAGGNRIRIAPLQEPVERIRRAG